MIEKDFMETAKKRYDVFIENQEAYGFHFDRILRFNGFFVGLCVFISFFFFIHSDFDIGKGMHICL